MNFVCKNLYEQFTKIANVYFLVELNLLQLSLLDYFGNAMVPAITTSKGLPVSLAPLIVILMISALKDAVEDYSRHQADNKENNHQYDVYNGEVYVPIESHKVLIGNLLKVRIF